MTETAKKKRGMPSSFTILLALLAIVAVITVIVSGTSGGAVTAARLSDFCTAPIKGFADALPVCLFVMILGGFLGMMTETGALDNGIAVLVQKLKGCLGSTVNPFAVGAAVDALTGVGIEVN